MPKKKRSKATASEWRKAYEELEQYVWSMLNDNMAKNYEILNKQYQSIVDKVGSIDVNRNVDFSKLSKEEAKYHLEKNAEDQAYVDKYLEKAGKMSDSLRQMRENSVLSKFIVEKESSTLVDNIENN